MNKFNSILILFFIFLVPLGYAQENDSFVCGESFTDSRDGREYKTVQIGDQCWMAENLNIGKMVDDMQQSDNGVIEKTCYENDPENCEVYGGLYTWGEAMTYIKREGTQGICPDGWHLPSRGEWDQLREHLGRGDAGQKMKAKESHDPAWDGNNSSGFTALPAGVGYEARFGRKGHWSVFWTSTEVDEDFAWFSQLDNFWYPRPPKYKKLYIGNHFVKENGFSVRCIKNKE